MRAWLDSRSPPLRLVVGFAPGGAADYVARSMAEAFSKAMGQPVLIDNKPGNGSSIAADIVAKSPPDGYTLLIASPSSISVNPALNPKLAYKPGDLLPVTKMTTSPLVLAVDPATGIRSVPDLIAAAKKEPGKLSYFSSGNGSFWDFLMSSRRQEELTELLDRVLALPPVADLKPEARTRRVHYDWLEAGEHSQRTVAQLSQQLRRFLDDQAWAGKPPDHGHPARHRKQGAGLAVPTPGFAAAWRRDEHRRARGLNRTGDGTPPSHAGRQTPDRRNRAAGGRR